MPLFYSLTLQKISFRRATGAPHIITFSKKCSIPQFIKEFNSNVLTCEVLKIFLFLSSYGRDDPLKRVTKSFLA